MRPADRTSGAVVVLVTCPDPATGERLAETLLEEKLAACVNLIPGLTSLYRWEGKLCRDIECLLLIKTRRGRLAALTRRVQALHPYALPEIVALSIAQGSAGYLRWLRDSTR
ncbi:MAG: divalent-cation tolerance protein CutA [Candidatus Methylomirabilota bacterium]